MSQKTKVLQLISDAISSGEQDIWNDMKLHELVENISTMHKKAKAIRNNQFNYPKCHEKHFNRKIEADLIMERIQEFIYEENLTGLKYRYIPLKVKNDNNEWANFMYKDINITIILSL